MNRIKHQSCIYESGSHLSYSFFGNFYLLDPNNFRINDYKKRKKPRIFIHCDLLYVNKPNIWRHSRLPINPF